MGEYICIAQNGIPPAKSKSVTLQVNCEYDGVLPSPTMYVLLHICVQNFLSVKPQIFISENVFGAPRHTKITIACTIHAFPKAIAYWTDSEGNLTHVDVLGAVPNHWHDLSFRGADCRFRQYSHKDAANQPFPNEADLGHQERNQERLQDLRVRGEEHHREEHKEN